MTLAAGELSDRWSIVRGLFEAVSALADVQRARFLDFACPDAAIRGEVESLLEADRQVDWDVPSGVATTTEEPAPEIPGYRIERLLGSGGSGSVYAALALGTGRRVAIKTLRSLAGSQAMARFRQECRALARLSHPGIVQLVETGTATGSVTYLVMEFIVGTPLDRWASERRPSAAEAVAIVRGVLAALVAPHHRRSPGTILTVVAGPMTALALFAAAYLDAARATHGDPALLSPIPDAVGYACAFLLGALAFACIATAGFMEWLGGGDKHNHPAHHEH